MSPIRLLLVEDDEAIAAGLEYSLEQEGFSVTRQARVVDALSVLHSESFDLALLDLSLPDGSGYDICHYIKKERDMPVVFLTARDDEGNVVMGLDMGADDYIVKPFRLRELISRLRTVLRRARRDSPENGLHRYGDVCVDTHQGKVFKGGRDVFLTALEYRLLLILIQHEGQVLTRSQLLERIWDISGDFVNDNTLTVYIKRLREKIEDDPREPVIVQTVRGQGYRIG